MRTIGANEHKMADSVNNPGKDPHAAGAEAPPPDGGDGRQQPSQQPQQLQVDDLKAVSSYANFCRVTGTPEELIVDFGLNSQPVGIPTDPIVVTQRIILNYYTAKRLLAALQMSVQRHESVFGVLETDVQKRIAPGAQRQNSAAPES